MNILSDVQNAISYVVLSYRPTDHDLQPVDVKLGSTLPELLAPFVEEPGMLGLLEQAWELLRENDYPSLSDEPPSNWRSLTVQGLVNTIQGQIDQAGG